MAANAAANLVTHAWRSNVLWRCPGIYSAAGIGGAFFGSSIGKVIDGQRLLFFFALLMLVCRYSDALEAEYGIKSCRCLHHRQHPQDHRLRHGYGSIVGVLRHWRGFLIVPGLMAATGMPILGVVGSSLVAVTTFGLTTGTTHGRAWSMAAVFVVGGAYRGSNGGTAGTAEHRLRDDGLYLRDLCGREVCTG
ncbi:TSUP family transporter [Devosia sp.]|uniref:TSUP family transporter n=1 Tax=Devosia sp. TaxID=1871048 RepID=UPI0039C8A160